MSGKPPFLRQLATFAPCLVLTATLFASCVRSTPDYEIALPATPPLSRPVIGYGVINTNYTHVLDKQGSSGTSLGFLRKGSIVEVLERRPLVHGETSESWVLAKGDYAGWLREDELRIFPSRDQAQTAAKSMPQ